MRRAAERAVLLPAATKVELIRRAVAAGARRIEAVSFVRPDAVPAMADTEAVMAAVARPAGVSYIGLVLNQRGFARAQAAGVEEINVVVPVTESIARRNQNSGVEDLMAMAEQVVAEAAQAGLPCWVTLTACCRRPEVSRHDPVNLIVSPLIIGFPTTNDGPSRRYNHMRFDWERLRSDYSESGSGHG